jgi:predicted nuclease with TOPRIM domain
MKGWELEIKFVYLGYVMKVVKEIIEKLNEINALLEERLDASNMDVEFMMQRVEDMIDEFEEIEEFQFEEEED